MAKAIANVVIATDSFAGWVGITNQMAHTFTTQALTANLSSTGATVSGNSDLVGIFSANVVAAKDGLRGGTIDTPATLIISSNTNVTGAQSNLTSNVYINNSNTTINASNTVVSGGRLDVTSNTFLTTTGVTVTATTTTIAGGGAVVTSNTYLNTANVFANTAKLTVQGGTVDINSTVSVTNTVSVQSNTTVNGNIHNIGGNVNFDTGTLFIDSVNDRVGVKNTSPDAVVTVTGTANVSGAVQLGSTLGVTGAATLSSTLGVTGAANLASTLGVVGAVTLSNTLGVTGAANLASTLGVVGSVALSNTFSVAGAANLASTLGVVGATTLSNTLAVAGAANLATTLGVAGLTTLTTLDVTANANFDSGVLFVDTVNNRVGVNNTAPDAAVTVTGTANVSGAVVLGSTLSAGNTSITRLTASSVANLNSTVNISGATTVSNTLSVSRGATFSNTVALSGSATTFQNNYVVVVTSNTNIGAGIATPIEVATFDSSTYAAAKITARVKKDGASNVSIQELLVTHDGADTTLTVYGTVATPATSNLGVFSASLNTGNSTISINFLQTTANSSVVVAAHLLK